MDVWAAGGPHRIVTGGVPPLRGRTMLEKRRDLVERFPYLPRLLTAAPDDPKAMVAALLTEPCTVGADFGVIWMGCGELINMCGTGTLAIGTSLVELGLIPTADGSVTVVLESHIGLQELTIEICNGEARQVTVRMPPAFHYGHIRIELRGRDSIPVELAYGLNCLEPLVNCADIGVDLTAANAGQFIPLALEIRAAVMQALQGSTDLDPSVAPGAQVSFYRDDPRDSAADLRCLAIVGSGDIDTTPSGTSSCAQLAARFARGKLAVGERLIIESITGATLAARVAGTVQHAGRLAVIPEISGAGVVTRLQQIVGCAGSPG